MVCRRVLSPSLPPPLSPSLPLALFSVPRYTWFTRGCTLTLRCTIHPINPIHIYCHYISHMH
jgi:hypothetical protein